MKKYLLLMFLPLLFSCPKDDSSCSDPTSSDVCTFYGRFESKDNPSVLPGGAKWVLKQNGVRITYQDFPQPNPDITIDIKESETHLDDGSFVDIELWGTSILNPAVTLQKKLTYGCRSSIGNQRDK